MFLAHYNRLRIYGVTDPVAQQKILDSLTQFLRQPRTNPVHVIFFERENWTVRQGKNGTKFGSRGSEQPIRVANIG
jgi:hypothetical protein